MWILNASKVSVVGVSRVVSLDRTASRKPDAFCWSLACANTDGARWIEFAADDAVPLDADHSTAGATFVQVNEKTLEVIGSAKHDTKRASETGIPRSSL